MSDPWLEGKVLPVPPTAWAGVMRNAKLWCVDSLCGYRMQTVDPKGKQLLLPLDASDSDLGAAVLDALAHSRFLRPWERSKSDAALFDMEAGRKRYEKWVARLMKACGYKTRRSLFNKMASCTVDRREGRVTIMPLVQVKSERWGGIGEDANVIISADSSPDEIGTALRLAFSRCG